jgi:hypothetical protein
LAFARERDGVLPPAVKINGRKHWYLSALEQAERKGMSKRDLSNTA